MEERIEKTKRAIAIQYEKDKGKAPIITAVGKGAIADKIMKEASDNDVPIYEDDFQADTLSSLDVGSKIPKLLYDLVAEVLLFVEEIDERKNKN